MREAAILIGSIVLAAVHLAWYTRAVALRLWELTGGIREEGQLTHFGASYWAWTVPVHLPAGLFFAADIGCLGLVLLLAGSLVAGFAAALLAAVLFSRKRYGARSWCWRVGLFLAGWLWIPVPATVSWIYQWTVVY